MKFLDKLALKIFSILFLILGIIAVLLVLDVITTDMIVGQMLRLTDMNDITFEVLLGVFVILMLLALKGVFFASKPEDNGKNGIVLENNNGKLVLSKESLENLIDSVIKDVPGAESVSSKTILDKHNNLLIYITAVVNKDMMIKDVSNDIQCRIKDAMKKTADLEVKEVNIKVKNITSKKIKGLPAPTEEETTEVVEEDVEETDVEKEDNE